MKATPTKEIAKEYLNASFLTSAGLVSGAFSISAYNGYSTNPTTYLAFAAAGFALPGFFLSLKSFGRLWQMIPSLAPARVSIVESRPQPREITVNGKSSQWFMSLMPSLAFDPTLRDDPDTKSRTIKYQPEPRQLVSWRIPVSIRRERPPVEVVLYEDLVRDIIDKSLRQERKGKSHPLSQKVLCNLHYGCRGGRRLSIEEHAAFIQLGKSKGIIENHRQGTSGRLAGSAHYCCSALGIDY